MALELIIYQQEARKTALYVGDPSKKYYPYLGLAGEVGEVSEKVKKIMRDKNGEFSPEAIQDLKKELGDVLWYVANIASDLGLDLGDIGQTNIDKLRSRQERGKLQGSGDNR
jgi:NTP pyrophosphatase (non-canonical NTP hydrolase)